MPTGMVPCRRGTGTSYGTSTALHHSVRRCSVRNGQWAHLCQQQTTQGGSGRPTVLRPRMPPIQSPPEGLRGSVAARATTCLLACHAMCPYACPLLSHDDETPLPYSYTWFRNSVALAHNSSCPAVHVPHLPLSLRSSLEYPFFKSIVPCCTCTTFPLSLLVTPYCTPKAP